MFGLVSGTSKFSCALCWLDSYQKSRTQSNPVNWKSRLSRPIFLDYQSSTVMVVVPVQKKISRFKCEIDVREKLHCWNFPQRGNTWTQPPKVVCKMEAQLECCTYCICTRTHCLHVFAHFALICMLSQSLLTKFLHRSSVRSLLRMRCWLGRGSTKLKNFWSDGWKNWRVRGEEVENWKGPVLFLARGSLSSGRESFFPLFSYDSCVA